MIRFATRQLVFKKLATLATILVFAGLAPAQHLRQLDLNGTSMGASPSSGLVEDAQGNFYGTTNKGGAFDLGAAYELTVTGPNSATYTVLYNFGSTPTDAALPVGNLIMDAAGNLYGVTFAGGAIGDGAVFELSPPAQPGGPWTETILYSFQGGFNDGFQPLAGVVFDQAGNLYGTLSAGGGGVFGAVYQLSPPQQPGNPWTETILAPFSGIEVGLACQLVVDGAGNLYGTTQFGGDNNKGQVFEVSPPPAPGQPWNVSILHSFFGPVDGDYPIAGLTLGQGKSLALFGITSTSSSPQAPGPVVYVLLQQPGGNWIFEVVLQLSGNLGLAEAPLVFTNPITLFGTATGTGGSVFEISLAGGVPSLAASFEFQPVGQIVDITTPVLIGDHALYGTTSTGGKGTCNNGQGCGTIFQLTP